MKTTYCKRCRKPVGLMMCSHCLKLNNVALDWPSMFHNIVWVSDMAELNDYLEKWYGGSASSGSIREA